MLANAAFLAQVQGESILCVYFILLRSHNGSTLAIKVMLIVTVATVSFDNSIRDLPIISIPIRKAIAARHRQRRISNPLLGPVGMQFDLIQTMRTRIEQLAMRIILALCAYLMIMVYQCCFAFHCHSWYIKALAPRASLLFVWTIRALFEGIVQLFVKQSYAFLAVTKSSDYDAIYEFGTNLQIVHVVGAHQQAIEVLL